MIDVDENDKSNFNAHSNTYTSSAYLKICTHFHDSLLGAVVLEAK